MRIRTSFGICGARYTVRAQMPFALRPPFRPRPDFPREHGGGWVRHAPLKRGQEWQANSSIVSNGDQVMPGVFPDYPAPVARNLGADRALTLMRWGTPPLVLS